LGLHLPRSGPPILSSPCLLSPVAYRLSGKFWRDPSGC